MTLNGWIQIALFCAVVLALVKPLGWYMARVFNGERTFLSPVLAPVERGLYRAAGIDARQEQTWLGYGPRHAGLPRARLPAALRRAAPAGPAAFEPGRPVDRGARSRLQHLGELR